MSSKVERLRAQLRGMRASTERAAKNVVHAGETLVAGGGGAYLEGRMGDADGEWGYRGVPYLYMGAAVMYLTGLFAGDRWSADLFSVGTGMVGGHLFRQLYESGIESRSATTGGRRRITAGVRMPAVIQPPPSPTWAGQVVPQQTAVRSAGLGGLNV